MGVTELAPPRHVHFVGDHKQGTLHWQASVHENTPAFEGYSVFISSRSLVFASPDELPLAIDLSREKAYDLENIPDDRKIYIHVRSRNQKGDLGLPSLPEIIVQPDEASLKQQVR